MEGNSCKATERQETCLAIGSLAQMFMRNGIGREVLRDEALLIIGQNQKEGLVLQPSNTEKADFICSCCGCCCGMLRVHKRIPEVGVEDGWVLTAASFPVRTSKGFPLPP
jgi:electron transport complex protein RnfB